MAYRTRQEDSAEDSEVDDYQQLERERNRNDQKLKVRFEHIFHKYEHDFTGVGDEIDIESGDVVVDNGHLQYMRHEVDPGKSASSRFVRTFQEKLEHEDDSTSSDEDEDSYSEDDEEESDDGSEELEQEHARRGKRRLAPDPPTALRSIADLVRPAPRLAHLLVGDGAAERPLDMLAEDESLDGSVNDSISDSVPPPNMLGQLPAVQDSKILQADKRKRSEVGPDTIEALGASIANQLAQLMAGPAKIKSKKARKRSVRTARESAWDYPEIARAKRRKRRRHSTTEFEPRQPPTSPPGGSPGTDSLWAPEGSSVRDRKRRKLGLAKDKQHSTPLNANIDPRLLSSGSRSTRGDARRCWNCSLTGSLTWHKGPHGQDLCSSCGKYYEHHRRMKAFDSPTPSIDDEELLEESEPETPEAFKSAVRRQEKELYEKQPKDAEHEHQSTEIEESFSHARSLPDQVQPERREPQRVRSVLQPVVEDTRPLNVRDWTPADMASDTRHEPLRFPYSANTSRTLADTLSPTKRAAWTDEEDAAIIRMKENDELTWDQIARHLPQRSLFAVQGRYSNKLQNVDCPGRRLLAARDQSQIASTPRAEPPRIRAIVWNEEKDEILLELREDQELEWQEIATRLTGCTSEEVEERYDLLTRPKTRGEGHAQTETTLNQKSPGDAKEAPSRIQAHFSAEEDALIVRLRERERLEWSEIARRWPHRNLHSMSGRYSRWLAPNKRKIQRTARYDRVQGTIEDRLLAVDPELFGGRRFTSEEDALIKRLRNEERLDWQEMESNFNERTANALKHRYNYMFSAPAPQPKKQQIGSGGSKFVPPWRFTDATTHHFQQPGSEGQPKQNSDTASASSPQVRQTVTAFPQEPISKTPFTGAEDFIISEMRGKQGRSWGDISELLPGRTVNSISARFAQMQQDGVIAISPPNAPVGHATTPASKSLPTLDGSIAPASAPPIQGTRMVFMTPHARNSGKTAMRNEQRVSRFTPEEDAMILKLREDGVEWNKIAERFTGQTAASLSNHYRQRLRYSTRQSLPVKLPTAQSRGGRSLLRKALGNSLRRRSDDATTGVPIDSSSNAQVSASASDRDDPSRQLSNEMLDSIDTDLSPIGSEDTGSGKAAEQTSPATSDGSDIQMFDSLMQAATKFSIQQNNPVLFARVREIYDKDPNDPRLHQLLDATANISVTATDVLQVLDEIAKSPHKSNSRVDRARPIEGSVSIRGVAAKQGETRLSHESDLESPSVRTTRSRRAATSEQRDEDAWTPPHSDAVNTTTSRARRSRRMASQAPSEEIVARSNAEIVSLPYPERRRDRKMETLAPPDLTYAQLITAAFGALPLRPLQCKDIYNWIEDNFQYYHGNKCSWKARVRTELTKDPSFKRTKLDDGSNAWLLAVTPNVPGRRERTGRQQHDDDANDTATTDGDNDAVAVSGPIEKRQLRPRARSEKRKQPTTLTTAGETSLAPESDKGSRQNTHSKNNPPEHEPRRNAKPPAITKPLADQYEIPDSEDEASDTFIPIDDDDEITLMASPPTTVSKRRQKLAEISRDSDSTPAALRWKGDQSSRMSSTAPTSTVAEGTVSSSSPSFVKLRTPASVYKGAATPKPILFRAPRAKQDLPAAQVSTPVVKLRSSGPEKSESMSISKRVVETPAREMDPDEDELA